jgi:biopolymer transport protein ExbD
MRFQPDSENDGMPVIDLVPMLTVMLGVLSYFVVTSASAGNDPALQVDLPPEQSNSAAGIIPEPFVVKMDASGQPSLNGEPMTSKALSGRVQTYLTQNKDSTVYLVPSQELPYEKVMQFLGEMRTVGGDRVSLALEDLPVQPSGQPSTQPSAQPPANATAPDN